MTEQKEKPLLLLATDEAINRVETKAMDWWHDSRGNENPANGDGCTQISVVMEYLLSLEGVTMYPHKQWKKAILND